MKNSIDPIEMYKTASNDSQSHFSYFSYHPDSHSDNNWNMSQSECEYRACFSASREIRNESYEINPNYYNSTQSKRGRKPQHISCQSKKSQILYSNYADGMKSGLRTQNDDDYVFESLLKAYQSGLLSKAKYKRLIANERERRRMHGLNDAFEHLRSVLPSLGSNKQFSKYETLQMAKRYISALREILCQESTMDRTNYSTDSKYPFYN